MNEFRRAAELLVKASAGQLATLANQEIIEAVQQYRHITKGNAKKRQILHIASLIRKQVPDNVQNYIERLDSSSRTHQLQIHKLERWRESLTSSDPEQFEMIFREIINSCPNADRQQIRNLSRLAIAEKVAVDSSGEPSTIQYRRLFQYLRSVIP